MSTWTWMHASAWKRILILKKTVNLGLISAVYTTYRQSKKKVTCPFQIIAKSICFSFINLINLFQYVWGTFWFGSNLNLFCWSPINLKLLIFVSISGSNSRGWRRLFSCFNRSILQSCPAATITGKWFSLSDTDFLLPHNKRNKFWLAYLFILFNQ